MGIVADDKAKNKEVGRRLRAARLKEGLSQTQLAGAMGVAFQQVQKYERGVNRTPVTRLMKAAEHLGLHVTALLPGHSELDAQLAQAIAGLSDEQKRLFLANAQRARGTPMLMAAE